MDMILGSLLGVWAAIFVASVVVYMTTWPKKDSVDSRLISLGKWDFRDRIDDEIDVLRTPGNGASVARLLSSVKNDRRVIRLYDSYMAQSHRTHEKKVVVTYLLRKTDGMEAGELWNEVGKTVDELEHVPEENKSQYSVEVLETMAEIAAEK